MTYLNEYEVEDACRLFMQDPGVPNLQTAVDLLGHLVAWTNSNSDGWTYWRKPRQAATKLVEVIEAKRRQYLRGEPVIDMADNELKDCLRPIKSFLTKQGIDYNADLPWAAVLPAA